MTRIGMLLGLAAVVSLGAWGIARVTAAPEAAAAEPAAESTNHDEAARRFRTNQSSHWRHVMLGRR